MKRLITIRNLKGIRSLDFELPNKFGVYLLVGENGAGKTTLLTCMHRIKNSFAFADNFPKSSKTDKFDQYKDAEIIYESSEGRVVYRKKKERWHPSPHGASAILNAFEFESSIFAKADAARIGVKKDELENGPLEAPSEFMKKAIADIFSDNRFDNICILKNKNGRRWFNTFFVSKDKSGALYSEKRFSSGELALLRLISRLENVPDKSLVLLDEVELALHPRIQRKLLKFLHEQAEEKNLIVIVATHSQTLIANERPANIILLENNNGEVTVKNPCYPAEAMQSIDIYNGVMGDYLLLVEDEMASKCLKEMCIRVVESGAKGKEVLCPILPVAGFEQTAKFAINCQEEVPEQTSVKAVLDQDAFESSNSEFNMLADRHKEIIFFLGFTPEPKLIELIQENAKRFDAFCRQEYKRSAIEILDSVDYKSIQDFSARKKAKKQFEYIVSSLTAPTESDDAIKGSMIKELISYMDIRDLKKIVCPIFC